MVDEPRDLSAEDARSAEGPTGGEGSLGVRREKKGTRLQRGSAHKAWVEVKFAQTYKSPVVIAGIPSYTGPNEVVVSVKDVTSTGFKMHLHETLNEKEEMLKKDSTVHNMETININEN